MISNCLIVALAFRTTHQHSSMHASLEDRGPGGLFPHFYVLLEDGGRVEFRSDIKPLPWIKQLLFKGHMEYS